MELAIVIKMDRGDYWGHRMINFSDMIKVVPKHHRKEAKIAIKELYKKGYLNRKPGIKNEFRYSLKIDKKSEIELMIKKDTFNV